MIISPKCYWIVHGTISSLRQTHQHKYCMLMFSSRMTWFNLHAIYLFIPYMFILWSERLIFSEKLPIPGNRTVILRLLASTKLYLAARRTNITLSTCPCMNESLFYYTIISTKDVSHYFKPLGPIYLCLNADSSPCRTIRRAREPDMILAFPP